MRKGGRGRGEGEDQRQADEQRHWTRDKNEILKRKQTNKKEADLGKREQSGWE
jgi:hypothetical protein